MSRQRRTQRGRSPSESGGPESGPPRAEQGSSAQPLPAGSDPEHEALIDEAVALFSRRYGRTFSREEARQAMERLTAFFELLHEWRSRGKENE